jgi:hypothetical protein
MATLIKTDGKAKPFRELPSFEECRNLLRAHIEIVRINSQQILLVDEEGLMKRLPRNESASKISGQDIVGDAILLGTAEEVRLVLGD